MRQYYLQIITLTVTVVLITAACSTGPKPLETVVQGTISVADSLDDTGDFSDIGITIITRDSANAMKDTLFHKKTDKSGNFEGKVQFPDRRYYTLFLSRNGNDIGSMGVILANQDTLTINAQLPNIEQTLTLQSHEHEAMNTFTRVDRHFQQIGVFASSGILSDSQLVDEVKKWSDLYWQVYNRHENTIAANLAAEKSANLLNTWNQEEMLARIDTALPDDYMISVALSLAKPYIAEAKGFEAASSYLDSLAQITDNKNVREVVEREKIKMYFDSSRVKEAKGLLADYEDNYSESSSSKKWVRRIRYDLNYLAPGVTAPDFSFVTMQGDTVNHHRLKGVVYILEFSPLANTEYQNDYDRTFIINEIYKNYGLKIFTVPLDQSEITVNAFFEERRKAWSVAKLGTFDVQDIIKKFNVVQVPTRLLIDQNGVLIRKYERDEFEDVIQGLNKAFKTYSPS